MSCCDDLYDTQLNPAPRQSTAIRHKRVRCFSRPSRESRNAFKHLLANFTRIQWARHATLGGNRRVQTTCVQFTRLGTSLTSETQRTTFMVVALFWEKSKYSFHTPPEVLKRYPTRGEAVVVRGGCCKRLLRDRVHLPTRASHGAESISYIRGSRNAWTSTPSSHLHVGFPAISPSLS